jgi:hypothetical protein
VLDTALIRWQTRGALAICGIRRPELACENTSCCRLLRARSREEAYNLKHASAHLYEGGMDTVQRILTFITRLTRFCLQSLQHSYVTWTTPGPPRCCWGHCSTFPGAGLSLWQKTPSCAPACPRSLLPFAGRPSSSSNCSRFSHPHGRHTIS